MTKILKMRWTALVLMLAASMSLECQMAFAEPDAEQGSTVISVEQNETSAAADASTQAADAKSPDAKSAVSGVAAPAAPGESANAQKPENKAAQADSRILSTNPEDANKHPAWRKREANKAHSNLKALRESMRQQGAQ